MIIAGAVQRPTDEVFVKHFLDANLGAANGLAMLNVVNKLPKKASKTATTTEYRVSQALELYRYIQSRLHSFNCSSLLPDIIHYEHLLCKVLRAATAKTRYRSYKLFNFFTVKAV